MKKVILISLLAFSIHAVAENVGAVTMKVACADIDSRADLTEANINESIFKAAGKDELMDLSAPAMAVQKNQVCVTLKLKTVSKN